MKNDKIKEIIQDGLVLFAVSTAVVIAADRLFAGLKGKVPKDDPVVTAISQGETKGVSDAVQEAITKRGEGAMTVADQHGRTALMRAAYTNLADAADTAESDAKRAEMAVLLLDKGARIDAVDHDGWTALMWASWSGLPKVVNCLLGRGAAVDHADHQGNTALIIAAQRGNEAIVRALLDKGASTTARNKAGHNARAAADAAALQHPGKKEEETYARVRALLH